MRVAIDASRAAVARRTGTENYSLRVIEHLAKLDGSNSYTLYYNQGSLDSLDLPANFRPARIPLPRLWTHARLSAALLADRPDVLFIPAHVLPALCPARSVVTIHDLGYLHFPQSHALLSRLYLQVSTWFSARYAGHVIAVSETTKRDIVRYCRVDPDKITVVHHGYDPRYRPMGVQEIGRIREKYGLDLPYFVHIGTLQPRKNLPRLIRAFRRFKEQGRPHELLLVGKAGWLCDSIAPAGRDRDVRALGYLEGEDLPALVAGATALVMPSLYEGFGLPALEAMACGTPVIVSNTSSLPEVVGDAGIMVDPLDQEAITGALGRLAGDPALCAGLRERGLERAGLFSWEKCAGQTLEVLKRVVRG